jgi:hypothetical protein
VANSRSSRKEYRSLPAILRQSSEYAKRCATRLHARSVRLVEYAADTLFGGMSDSVREASRVAHGRTLSPESIREVCSFGFSRSSAHPIDRTETGWYCKTVSCVYLGSGNVAWADAPQPQPLSARRWRFRDGFWSLAGSGATTIPSVPELRLVISSLRSRH